jgi:hypothetical protein
MAKLTMAERRKLPLSDFAVPSKAPGPGSYPIEDANHRKAAGMLSAGKPVAGKVKAAIKRKSAKTAAPKRPWQNVANEMLRS